MISYFILFVAGCFEVAGISTLNGYANAGTVRRKVTFLLATIVLFAIALSSLSISMREIPLSLKFFSHAVCPALFSQSGALT